MSLLRLAEDEHVLLLTMHHIASDGWSLRVLWRELEFLYDAYRLGANPDLPDLPVQYADYAVWQRSELQGQRLERLLQHWRSQLENVSALELPTDRPRPALPTYRGARHNFELKEELFEQLKSLAIAEGVTLHMTLLAAFQVLLGRISGQDDIAVGTPIAGRNHAALEDQIGFFVNTLVLRTELSGDATFRELLGRVRKVSLAAYDHQDLPFEKLVEELQPERHLSRNPLVQVLFQLLSLVALDSIEGSLSYVELERRSNRLAHHLRKLGVGPEVVMGVCLERGLDLVVGMLGVLKAGGAYLPLDPSYPPSRLAYMVSDSEALVLVSHSKLADRLAGSGLKRVELDSFDWAASGLSESAPEGGAGPDSLAYVIYTSGSTGRPKGVEVLHRSVVNFLESMRREPGVNAEDVLLAVTNLTFDIAVLELLLPLTVGGTVVIAPETAVTNGERLRQLIDTHDITFMQATPATWQLLIQSGWKGRRRLKMLCGGEALTRPLADALLERSGELWNMYGPTETTIWSATTRVACDGPISIGRPIANTQLYVLDARCQPVPRGVVGELCIGGDGLARGYLGRPELTAERFVADPFRGNPEARMYRTGDLVRRDASGRLLFLGRAGHQVKLRGFRIELGEIERRLGDHPAVEQAAVLLHGAEAGDQHLVAYVAGGSVATPTALKRHLAAVLPDYMMPARFVAVDAMPLSSSGKIDRKCLAALKVPAESDGERVPPSGPVQEAVAAAFGELIDHPAIGAHDDFFELGGHSLLATRLVSRLRSAFEVQLPLSAVFESPTVAGLAEQVERRRQTLGASKPLPPIEPVSRARRLPLSFSQRRLWFLDQLGAAFAYNIQLSLRFEGRLDEAVLKRVLSAVTKRHEALRTSFGDDGGRPYQRIAPAVHVPSGQPCGRRSQATLRSFSRAVVAREARANGRRRRPHRHHPSHHLRRLVSRTAAEGNRGVLPRVEHGKGASAIAARRALRRLRRLAKPLARRPSTPPPAGILERTARRRAAGAEFTDRPAASRRAELRWRFAGVRDRAGVLPTLEALHPRAWRHDRHGHARGIQSFAGAIHRPRRCGREVARRRAHPDGD